MARAQPAEMPDDCSSRESEVPHCVDQLMPHEFIREAEAAGVQDAIAADDDRIIERSPARQTGRLQPGPIVEQAEGACRRELSVERVRIDAQRDILVLDKWIIEVNLETHREPG